MIQNRWVFKDTWNTPILHRGSEKESLSRLLEPATLGSRAEDILIHGPSGVGKTATTRWMLKDLYQRANVQSVGIECSGQTRNGIIHEAVSKHPGGTAVPRNKPREELLEVLDDATDSPFVIILDEADVIPDLDVLGDLLSIDLVSVIAITHSDNEWLSRVDRNVRPHFHGDSQIEFWKYRVEELVDILEPRVEHGLVGEPVSTGQLEWIADETNGVARFAIKSLLSAAELAVERGHDRFHERDVADSFERAKDKMRHANLQSLPPVYQRLYELVRQVGPIPSRELKPIYREHRGEIFERRDPVGWRRVRDYLSKMVDYDLLEDGGETNAKQWDVVDSELEAPIEFDIIVDRTNFA